jgi:hypothetical protein
MTIRRKSSRSKGRLRTSRPALTGLRRAHRQVSAGREVSLRPGARKRQTGNAPSPADLCEAHLVATDDKPIVATRQLACFDKVPGNGRASTCTASAPMTAAISLRSPILISSQTDFLRSTPIRRPSYDSDRVVSLNRVGRRSGQRRLSGHINAPRLGVVWRG